MKQFLFSFALLLTEVLYGAIPTMRDTIEKDFKKNFPKAEQVKWYKTDSMYEVVFINDQVNCRMSYKLDGTTEKTIRYYKQENLAPFVLARVKRKYPGKKIFGITEETSIDGLNYHIVLEDEKQWLHIQSDPVGNTFVANQYRKTRTIGTESVTH